MHVAQHGGGRCAQANASGWLNGKMLTTRRKVKFIAVCTKPKTRRFKADNPSHDPSLQPTNTAMAKKTDEGLSQIDAALAVLKRGRSPLSCHAMVEAMTKHEHRTLSSGKTPEGTLYADLCVRFGRVIPAEIHTVLPAKGHGMTSPFRPS